MPISLEKNQTISLEKTAGTSLSNVTMGLGWDVAKPKGFLGKLLGGGESIDLDASALIFDSNGQLLDNVWFRQLQSKDGSVVHTGDNRTGAGEGDDEQIRVNLSRLARAVQTVVFTVNSFSGQDFSKVENAYCRLINDAGGAEIARFNLSSGGSHTGQVMARVYRDAGGWNMQALGLPSSGRTFQDMLPDIRRLL
ncbi:TerD family protein [Deinococcus ruber]|uniref:Tellurium resistance protein TerZ n=1 Tax=Deinococcus ruber TaxID=1848197 RepID=A0A918FFL7_9DEIO|nr:TerD family protein [Deinococcus ruber]GGR34989.1 tellurium resistance protein TerZ [Deinococcus ruber]